MKANTTPDPRILAWVCRAKDGHPFGESTGPVVVYAAKRSQAIKIAFNHGNGFDVLDFTDIRCRRFPEEDGGGRGFGMYDPDTGKWLVESFRHFFRSSTR